MTQTELSPLQGSVRLSTPKHMGRQAPQYKPEGTAPPRSARSRIATERRALENNPTRADLPLEPREAARAAARRAKREERMAGSVDLRGFSEERMPSFRGWTMTAHAGPKKKSHAGGREVAGDGEGKGVPPMAIPTDECGASSPGLD